MSLQRGAHKHLLKRHIKNSSEAETQRFLVFCVQAAAITCNNPNYAYDCNREADMEWERTAR